MATEVVETIKSSGGDFTTWAAWEAATDNDLVTADEVRIGEIYDVNETAVFTMDGAITDATRYRKLTVAAANRHVGVWDTGKANVIAGDTDGVLMMTENFSRVSYLQIRNNHGSAPGSGIKPGGTNCFIEQCLARADQVGGFGHGIEFSGANCTARNSIGFESRIGFRVGTATGVVLENSATVGNSVVGVDSDNAIAVTLRNHYSGGNTGNNYREGGSPNIASWSFTTCMSSNAESTETGLTNNIAYSTANFVNVTAGSIDAHLVPGSALIDVGTDLSGSFTIDIDGDERVGPWDVGVDSYVKLPSGAIFNRILRPRAFAPGLAR